MGLAEAETELLKRDRILDAIAKIAAELMAAPFLDDALPSALRQAGEAVAADRAVLLEVARNPDGGLQVSERGIWNAPDVEPQMRAGEIAGKPDAGILGRELATLPPAQAFRAFPARMKGALGEFLRRHNVLSLLLVPIVMEGELWGYFGFDDCHTERKWTATESDALQVLGGIIGGSVARARFIAELKDAKRILENSTTVLFRCKAETNMPVMYVSENVSKWGYAPEQFLESPTFYQTLIHPDDAPQAAVWIESLLADSFSAPSWLTFRWRLADGNYRWVENHISAIRDPAGRLLAFEGMIFDVDERKKAEEQINFLNTLFQTAMEKSPNGFLVVGADRKVLACNQRFLALWNIPPETAKANLDEVLLHAFRTNLRDPERFRAALERLYEHPDQEVQDEIELRNGSVFERYSGTLRGPEQQYLGRIFFFRDITERKHNELEMARLARTDSLTGLANRTAFLDRLGLALAAARRGDTPFAVLYVDLDNFKEVNDSLGHATGDILLKAAAQRMTGVLRETDQVARFGGDEFAVLQTDVADPATAGTLAAKLRAVLAEPLTIDGSMLRVTATIGIALWAPEVRSATEIVAQADRALYYAKEEGRDRYRFHSQELDSIVHERVTMSEELRAGIDRNELELYYQPQVTVASGRIVGMEALVRWNHPRLGQLKPGAFLPAAERAGAIIPLGAWVLDQACRQFRLWRDQGLEPPLIAVNLSGAQLRLGLDFCGQVQTILSKWGLSPGDLEFDVPEAVLADSYGTNPDVLQRLRDMGVRLALDDFGAEYTSMGRIKAYRVERLKIAPDFIHSMTSNEADAASIRLIVQLASKLGVEIVAKSVETQAQQAFLLSAAAGTNAQGFFYSKPLAVQAATDFLSRKKMESALTTPSAR